MIWLIAILKIFLSQDLEGVAVLSDGQDIEAVVLLVAV